MSAEDTQGKKNFTLKELDGSRVEITVEIPSSDFDKHRAGAIRRLGEAVHIDGFRKGHIPESILLSKVGEGTILQETAEMAIAEFYLKTLQEEKVEAIGKPSITITKMARGNPLGIKIVTAVLPKVLLPDYGALASKINAKKIEVADVADKEVDDTLGEIQKNFTRAGKSEKTEPPGKEEKVPELTDEFAQKLGDFKTVADLKKKVRENLGKEKEMKVREKRRLEIIESILKEVSITIPDILIESEIEKMLAQFKESITSMGLTMEGYFSHIKKTEEDMKKEWKGEAEKRVKTQLVLAEIAR